MASVLLCSGVKGPMEIGPKTQAKLDALVALKAALADAEASYNRHREEANAMAAQVNALTERLLAGDDVLDEWRAVSKRMNHYDDNVRQGVWDAFRAAQADADRVETEARHAFQDEHLGFEG